MFLNNLPVKWKYYLLTLVLSSVSTLARCAVLMQLTVIAPLDHFPSSSWSQNLEHTSRNMTMHAVVGMGCSCQLVNIPVNKPCMQHHHWSSCFSSPTAHSAEGLLHLDFPAFCNQFGHNLKPCDWSSCPKAHLLLVETGSNVLEEGQVLGSRGGNAIYSTSLHILSNLVLYISYSLYKWQSLI